MSESLADSLARLDALEEAHLQLGGAMLAAYGGALYGMDLLAIGALNRSKAHIAGFRMLLNARNLVCAGALLRLQLDTAMRFYAAFLVEKPHDFALAVLGGARVSDIRDRDGHQLKDSYLKRKLAVEYEWVPRVYDQTSGYVHLSSTHLMSALNLKQEAEVSRQVELKISAEDKPLPECIYVEAADAFGAATDILLRYVQGWAVTKAHPEAVEERRLKGSGSDEGA
jgi:hypothetical protein